jgi:transcriptional regulator with XRE-family HTH domain
VISTNHNILFAILIIALMKNIIGKNVKAIREGQGMTQEQLAIRLEVAGWRVDRFIVFRIERGERQVLDKEVLLIAKVLKVSVSSLFGKSE